MATNYSIRIDFDREQENPQRVFIAMAMYIEGFNALQESFMQGFGKGIEFDTSLEKTREGSCIADIAIKSERYNKRGSLRESLRLYL